MKEISGKNLIFNVYALHGFTGSGLDFIPLKSSIESILSGESVVLNWLCPSLPGHGDSSDFDCSVQGKYDFLKKYIYLNTIQEIDSFRSHEHKNILIAYSMGSRLGLYHATKETDFWDAIILIGVNPGIRSETERALRRKSDKELSDKIEKKGLSWFLNYWNSLPIIRSQFEEFDDFQKARQRRKNSLDTQGLKNSLVHFGQGVFPDLWELIPDIKSPLLLINGDLDLKYCEISHQFSCSNRKVQCEIIKGCGHAPHFESPKSTAEVIAAFFKKHLI